MTAESMDLAVVDSSVAYKWLNPGGESSVEAALDLLEQHRSGRLVLAAPAHLPAEVANGLFYSDLDDEGLRLGIEGLEEAELVLFPLTAELLLSAADLARMHRLTIHDALFAALAIRLDCELVTADRARARVTECPVRLLR